MGYNTRYIAPEPRRASSGWLLTMCWMLPLMVVVAAGGYVFAREKLAKTMLPNTIFQPDRPHPKPLLTPSEATNSAKDVASPVWNDGVNSADVPKLNPHDYAAEKGKSYVFSTGRRHRTEHARHRRTNSPSATDDNTNPTEDTSTPPSSSDNQSPDGSPDAPPGGAGN